MLPVLEEQVGGAVCACCSPVVVFWMCVVLAVLVVVVVVVAVVVAVVLASAALVVVCGHGAPVNSLGLVSVEQDGVSALGRNWHREHFVCAAGGCTFEHGVYYTKVRAFSCL
jgi:hypothetical protein